MKMLGQRTARMFLLLAFLMNLFVVACDVDGSGESGNAFTPADEDNPTDDGDIDEPDFESEGELDKEIPDCNAIYFLSISGSVVNENGLPFSGIMCVICLFFPDGSSTCLNPVRTDDKGEYTIVPPVAKRCIEAAVVRLVPPDNPDIVILTCPIDLGLGGDVVVGDPGMLIEAPGSVRDPLGDGGSAHEISASDGTVMTVIPDDLFLFESSYENIDILIWDSVEWGWPCFIDAIDPPDGLIAITPEVLVGSADGAHIAFPSIANLEQGTEVDVFALGTVDTNRLDGSPVKEGEWTVISSAVVSSDESMLETQVGQGLPFLTWIGWKQR